jgi:hypothetical protein
MMQFGEVSWYPGWMFVEGPKGVFMEGDVAVTAVKSLDPVTGLMLQLAVSNQPTHDAGVQLQLVFEHTDERGNIDRVLAAPLVCATVPLAQLDTLVQSLDDEQLDRWRELAKSLGVRPEEGNIFERLREGAGPSHRGVMVPATTPVQNR